jgi:hypothetical protein
MYGAKPFGKYESSVDLCLFLPTLVRGSVRGGKLSLQNKTGDGAIYCRRKHDLIDPIRQIQIGKRNIVLSGIQFTIENCGALDAEFIVKFERDETIVWDRNGNGGL